MANRPIPTPLPADLPQNWTTGQTVAPTGAEVGLSLQHGYNYQSKQINDAQAAVNLINTAFDGLVPTTRKINGDALTGDINLTPAKVGADPAGSASAVQSNLTSHVDNMVRHITAEERALWNAKRPNIIRTHPIAPGNTVEAGDVVDVVGGGLSKTWYGSPNKKTVFDTSKATTDTSIAVLTPTKQAFFFGRDNGSFWGVTDTSSGDVALLGSSWQQASARSYLKVCRLNDSKIARHYVENSGLYAEAATISGGNTNLGTAVLISTNTTTYNDIIPLSETTFLSVYNRGGLKAKVSTAPVTTITSGTESALPGSTNAAYISAARLPNAPNGDKRVCVCYSDAGDGNKGKAVIVTINASNVVSWGMPVVFASAGTRGTACIEIDGRVLVVNAPSVVAENVKYTLLMIDSSTISLLGSKTLGNYSEATVAIAKVADGGVVLYNSSVGGGGRSSKVTVVGDTLSHSSNYPFNGTASASNPSIAGIADDKVIAAYTDDGNSSYGTATILTVKGNQIAGSFTDISSQAIALQSGTAGQSIDIIYDGVAELPGITAGTQITSPGVQGYAPQDGWLWVRPEWDAKPFVTGSYTGDLTAIRFIDLGFTPSAVVVYTSAGTQNTGSSNDHYVGGLALRGLPCKTAGSPFKTVISIEQNGFNVYRDVSGSSNVQYVQTNGIASAGDTTYYYVALRE